MIPDLMAEDFDAILSGMSITAKREMLIDFTEAYYPPTPSVYVVRAGEGEAAVRGRIGASPNTIYSDYFTEMGVTFVSLDITKEAVEAVLDGEVDAVLVDHGYAVTKLAEYEGRLEVAGRRCCWTAGSALACGRGAG